MSLDVRRLLMRLLVRAPRIFIEVAIIRAVISPGTEKCMVKIKDSGTKTVNVIKHIFNVVFGSFAPLKRLFKTW